MGRGTKDNRERLIRFCTENGLKLSSTFFDKKMEEKVTYRPIKVGKKEPITARTHDQIDYFICRKKDNISMKDCKSDCRSKMETRHYPLMATLQVQFSKVKNQD